MTPERSSARSAYCNAAIQCGGREELVVSRHLLCSNGGQMKRREFISVGSAAAAWPLGMRVQQGGRLQLVAALSACAENDRKGISNIAAFRAALQRQMFKIARQRH